MYRTLLIILTIAIILVPFSGIPGGAEDLLMQVFAAVVLALVLLLPKKAQKQEKEVVAEETYGA